MQQLKIKSNKKMKKVNIAIKNLKQFKNKKSKKAI